MDAVHIFLVVTAAVQLALIIQGVLAIARALNHTAQALGQVAQEVTKVAEIADRNQRMFETLLSRLQRQGMQ